jgi:hypothetical protein
VALPIFNLITAELIANNGGAHLHVAAPTVALACLELFALGWFCARWTDRPVVSGALGC